MTEHRIVEERAGLAELSASEIELSIFTDPRRDAGEGAARVAELTERELAAAVGGRGVLDTLGPLRDYLFGPDEPADLRPLPGLCA